MMSCVARYYVDFITQEPLWTVESDAVGHVATMLYAAWTGIAAINLNGTTTLKYRYLISKTRFN